MLDEIKRQLLKTDDLTCVLEILLGAREALVILRVTGGGTSGELWVRNGVNVVGARTDSGESGYKALMQLMSVKSAQFGLERALEDPPGMPIEVDVTELLDHPQQVIESMKLRLSREASANQSGLHRIIQANQHGRAGRPADHVGPAEAVGPDDSASVDEPLRAVGRSAGEDFAEARPVAPYSSYKLSAKTDDLAERRRSEVEAAKLTPPATAITDEVAKQHASLLSPPVDDLNQRRVSDLEAAAQGEIVFPRIPSDEKAAASMPSALPPAPTKRADTTAVPVFQEETDLLFAPEPAFAPAPRPRQDTRLAQEFLRGSDQEKSLRGFMKSGLISALKIVRLTDFDAGEYARAVLSLRNVPKSVWIALGLSVLALPMLGVLAYQRVTMDRQIDAEDTLSIIAEVNSMMDEPYLSREQARQHFDIAAAERDLAANAARAAGLPSWLRVAVPLAALTPRMGKLNLPDFHNPFRPPVPKEFGAGTGAAPAAGGSQEDVDKLMPWQEPAHRPAALSSAVRIEITKQMQTAEALISMGRPRDALAMYKILLAKYPQDKDLRVAAIHACLICKDYATASAWCKEGMGLASYYGDYLVFNSLLTNMPKAGVQAK